MALPTFARSADTKTAVPEPSFTLAAMLKANMAVFNRSLRMWYCAQERRAEAWEIRACCLDISTKWRSQTVSMYAGMLVHATKPNI